MKNKLTLTIIGAIILIFSVITFNFLKENVSLNFGAPSQINIVSSTSSPPVSFTVGTTTAATQFGTTTVAIYGSTTIQTSEDTEYALWVQNAASSTVFQVDTVNSSTTAFGAFNTGVLNVASCTGCTGGNLTFDWFMNAGDLAIRPTTTVGITVHASSSIESLAVSGHLGASTTAQFATLSVNDLTAGAFAIGGGADAYLTALALTTNGQVFIGDGSGAPTAATLTGTANEITVTNGAGSITLDVPADFRTSSIILSASSTIQALQVQDTLQASTTSTFAGIYINSAGELRIPNGTAPTIAVIGDLALDSTNGQLVYFNAQENVISSTSEMSFVVGSTTRSASGGGAGFTVATSTWQIRRWSQPITLNELACELDNNSSSSTVEIGDGTNTTTPFAVGGDASIPNSRALTANNTFTEGERMFFSAGSPEGTPNELSCTIKYVKTRQ